MKFSEKKTLFNFYEELSSLSFFDKRKAQGLVKRANTAGFDLYYAYHEDGPDTWKSGWSSNDYKNSDDDVKLYEATDLIGKSKGGGSFRKGSTYTAECAIFIFCPLSTLMQDATLSQRKLKSVENKAISNATANYSIATEAKASFDKWQTLPLEDKTEIKKLQSEIYANMGQPGSRKLRKEKEKRIAELGGNCYPLSKWQNEAISFTTLEEYIEFRKEKAISELINNLSLVQIR